MLDLGPRVYQAPPTSPSSIQIIIVSNNNRYKHFGKYKLTILIYLKYRKFVIAIEDNPIIPFSKLICNIQRCVDGKKKRYQLHPSQNDG